MRTRFLPLLFSPLLLLAVACADQPLEPSGSPSHSKGKAKPGPEAPRLSSMAIGINAHGLMIGRVEDPAAGTRRAVRWITRSDGGISGAQELGTLEGEKISEAVGVNDAGLIVGYAEHDVWNRRAFIFDGTLRPLRLPDGALSSWAVKINKAGAAVGDVDIIVEGARVTRALVWLDPLDSAALPVQLPPLDGHGVSSARWVNESGDVAGWSGSGKESVNVSWKHQGGGIFSAAKPVEGLIVYAMNDEPLFVGVAEGSRAVALRSAGLVYLGSLTRHTTSWARGLNNPTGGNPVHIVGSSGPRETDERAVVWNLGAAGDVSGPVDVGLPGTHSRASAAAVNASGWIVGHGQGEPGTPFDAALWRPRPDGSGYDVLVLSATQADSYVPAPVESCTPKPGGKGCR
jgi:hypothetical protein